MEEKNIISKFRDELNYKGCRRETIESYCRTASHFLKHANNNPPVREDAKNYILKLKKEGKKPTYLRFVYYALKGFYKVTGREFLSSPPKLPDESIDAPAFSKDEIVNIIKSTKDKGSIQEKAFLSVSTTWGLRREEIIKIKPEDIKDNRVLIHTRKGGLDRKHSIPKEIKYFIYDYDWKDRVSQSRINNLFNIVLHKAGFDLNNYNGYSFHAIRRALVTELIMGGIIGKKVHHYLRWKAGQSMVDRYAKLPDKDIEEEIYKKHPFLPVWK